MSKITLQYSIVNDTAADAIPVESNFTRIESHINQELIEREGSVAMTGQLKLAGNPVAATDAASKGYVDGLFPIGFISMYGGSTDPAGGVWLLCDGRELETATYPELFSVIGSSFGSGAAGRFNIPDMRGRMPIGAGTLDAIGSTGGSRDLVVPTHNHTMNHQHAAENTGFADTDHTHTYSGNTATENAAHNHYVSVGEIYRYNPFAPVGYFAGGVPGNGSPFDILNTAGAATGTENQAHLHSFSGTTSGISANHRHLMSLSAFTGTTSTAGVAVANQNLPPYRSVSFLIKVR